MDINWDEAPEDCVGAVTYTGDGVCDYEYGRFITGFGACDHHYGHYCVDDNVYPEKDSYSFTPKQEIKPVYTQAMSDAGELPSVGMEFMWSQWKHEELKLATMLAISGGECWIELGDTSIIVGSITDCKPLPTPTPIELIANSLYLFTVSKKVDMVGQAYFTALDEEPMITNIRTNTSYSQDICTNIKTLTVESEK